ncbi:MAG TPA: NAD-dependent epimerase [Usitatibacter sp.]|jgi:UDP-glucuronate 4-epimerase|nr:NAD-dependent epimerase [Usitatibacter sp.]
MRILVTGAAGFIGYHVARRLLDRGDEVAGVDNLSDYYDPALKRTRIERLRSSPAFTFRQLDIADAKAVEGLAGDPGFDGIVNLAAQAGVRYSIENPRAYVEANVAGFLNILEAARHGGTRHLVYASTSSVYGLNTSLPFDEGQNTDHPVSFYAATKKANEAMAHSYAHLFGVPCTGLRFFTVYGPWGRPDMALFKFTKAILEDQPIPLFNHGRMVRDFTYVDDIVESLVRVLDRPPAADPRWNSNAPDPATSSAPWRIFNIGNSAAVELMAYVRAIEKAVGREAKLDMLPMQAGDVPATHADTRALEAVTGFAPATPVDEGVRRFVEWYRSYYRA